MATTAELMSRQLLSSPGRSRALASGQESFHPSRTGTETWVTATNTEDARTLGDWMVPISGGAVSAKDPRFGAVGDGVTDDTVALQAFLDYMTDDDVGYGIIPSGVYVSSATLTLTLPSSNFRRKKIAAYGAQLRPDTSTVGDALVIEGHSFDGFCLSGLTIYQYRNAASGNASTCGIKALNGYNVILDNCFIIAGDLSGAPITTYRAIVFDQRTKDTGGLSSLVRDCLIYNSPNYIRAGIWIAGVQNGLRIENNTMVRAQSHIVATYSELPSDPGDTYYGYVVNGFAATGNVSDLGDIWVEIIGRPGVAKSRWGSSQINNNRIESVTTFIDLTNEDQQPTDRTPPQIYDNSLTTVTNEIVNPNNIIVWGLKVDFTPTFVFGGAAVGMTFTTQTGHFVRRGSLVTFTATVTLSAKGSSTGTATVRGLPYDQAYDTPYATWWTSLTSGVGDTFLQALGIGGGKIINLYDMAGGDAGNLTEGDFEDTSSIRLSGTYMV